MTDLLPCEIVEPPAGQEEDAAVIWLHGLGASGHDFLPLLPELRLPPTLALRFVFPHAPAIPVTINAGYVMPAWYDISSLGEERHFNAPQLLASAAAVHKLIDRELARGVASERILLAGFSQGGAVNFQAALTYDKPLGGLLALSTYFPSADAVEVHPANHRLPILLCHGRQDPVLPLAMAERARERLVHLGFHPDFRLYDMDHSVCLEEVGDIAAWIGGLLLAGR